MRARKRTSLAPLCVLAAIVLAVVACESSQDVVYDPHDPPPVSTSPGDVGPARYVDPFIGTADSSAPHPVLNGAAGATFPGAALPFGAVQWSPDTPNAAPAGYSYSDELISGFSLTHLNGAGCPAARDFPIFPLAKAPDFSAYPQERFSHDAEKASPGFYEVKLGSGILVDLTASARTGFARFTFPDHADAHVLLSGTSQADSLQVSDFRAAVEGNDTLTGSRTNTAFCVLDTNQHTVYFAARFDRPFTEFGTFENSDAAPGAREVTSTTGGLFVRFDTNETRVVHMKVGISYVSVEGARANLEAENPGWDFDATHAAAVSRWNDYLSRVQIEGGTPDELRMFYTALYHALLQPAVFSDADGTFLGFDGQRKVDVSHPRYANFSGWDVYRSWIHLAAMIAPKEASDVVRSLVGAASECGALPQWSLANHETAAMMGDPADPTIAGAWAFGARDFDTEAALAAMKKGASDVHATCSGHPARPGLADYLARGFCPIDAPQIILGPTSTTQEYAVSDFSIAQFAKNIGNKAVHDEYLARGSNWRNVFDASRGYAWPRRAADVDGKPQFVVQDPASTDGFVEGNAAQYTFFVPHDAYGLIEGLGGDAATIARLDTLFKELNVGSKQPYFYIGNEPQFGTPWLYSFAGVPHRTQAIVRRLVRETFSSAPGGLPGNDDLGATSAWLAWAMLGMYPAIPGTGVLVLGSPSFPKATVTLGSGAKLVLRGEGADASAPYVQSMTWNGKPHTASYVSWDQIKSGGELVFVLSKNPNLTAGAKQADRPPAFYP